MATYEATVEVRFDARHSVRTPDGNMEQTHEHEWRVTACFRAERLNDDGFVVDFLAARKALDEIVAGLDGRDLNQIVAGDGASAERLAGHVAGLLQSKLSRKVYCVRVTEAPGCAAAFYPEAALP